VNRVHETVNLAVLWSTVDPRTSCGRSSRGSSPDGATRHKNSPRWCEKGEGGGGSSGSHHKQKTARERQKMAGDELRRAAPSCS
jgi:hypothetical protein